MGLNPKKYAGVIPTRDGTARVEVYPNFVEDDDE